MYSNIRREGRGGGREGEVRRKGEGWEGEGKGDGRGRGRGRGGEGRAKRGEGSRKGERGEREGRVEVGEELQQVVWRQGSVATMRGPVREGSSLQETCKTS